MQVEFFREAHIRIFGNTSGLKAVSLRKLERLSQRRSRSGAAVTPELARSLAEVSREIKRQIGLLIDRRGHVCVTIVGDARSLFLPDLSAYRRGLDRLCGLRLVHTHLHSAGLDDDDLTDLALLRLDMVVAIEVGEDALPGRVHMAHLLAQNEADLPWEILSPQEVNHLQEDFAEVIAALESEFARTRKSRLADTGRERAILVHVSDSNRTQIDESIAELNELSKSAGIDVVLSDTQRRRVDPKYVVGKGKLKKLVIKAMQLGAEAIIFDLNVSPTQIKNLAELTDLKILDRTQVILDIFAQRAETREGKIQVELAQLRYLLPLLSTKHTAMSRLTGGIGGRGPGETKLEIDRRRAQQRLAQLKREVDKLGKRRRLRRKRRTDKQVPTVSIVGYTNAGKSTLLNKLTGSSVTAEDKLFATLHPVSRRLRFPKEREVIITDTVGFIRKLPPELMEAFHTTFEEIEPANLLLIVLDASSNEVEEHYTAVRQLLVELGLDGKPSLVVLNKSDLCDPETLAALARQHAGIPVTALDKQTFAPLLEAMEQRLWQEAAPYPESDPQTDAPQVETVALQQAERDAV